MKAKELWNSVLFGGSGGGGIIPSGSKTINVSRNGTTTEDVSEYAEASIVANVPNSYSQSDEGKVVSNGALVSQGSTTVLTNGTYDTSAIGSTVVAVDNTYEQADEGKVVSNGALVSQTSATKTANGTYDTTLNNQVVVNVPSTPEVPSDYPIFENTMTVNDTHVKDWEVGASCSITSNAGGAKVVGEKICIKGDVKRSTTIAHYWIWGTITAKTHYSSSGGYDKFTLTCAGIRFEPLSGYPGETITQNGRIGVFGYAKISVDVAPSFPVEMQKLMVERELGVEYDGFTYSGLETKIGANAFRGCEDASEAYVSFPCATEAGHHAFADSEWYYLNIQLDALQTMGDSCFENCTYTGDRYSLSLPMLTEVPDCAFKNCTAFEVVDLGHSCVEIGAEAFVGSTATAILLSYEQGVVDCDATAFDVNTFSGTIYVPNDLVSSYENDAVWGNLTIDSLDNYNP